jgi:Plant mobile domain
MILNTRATRMRFMPNEQIMSILERFILDRLASIGTIQIDRDLISAIIERWRRETHTFHIPVGEMTVTLEDVSCL